MDKEYFITLASGAEEGPFDLLTMIRKIKAGKIDANTLIMKQGNSVPAEARQIQELSRLFIDADSEAHYHSQPVSKYFSLAINHAWKFLSNNYGIIGGAGLILIATIICGLLLNNLAGREVAYVGSFAFFWWLHTIFAAVILRNYRGQPFDIVFIHNHLFKNATSFIMAAIITAGATAAGTILMIIPGIVILTMLSLVPFILVDYPGKLFSSLHYSITLTFSKGIKSFLVLMAFMVLYLVCLPVFIISPFTMTLLTAAQADFYNELIK